MTEPASETPEEVLLRVLFPNSVGKTDLTPEEKAELKAKIEGVLNTLSFRERETIKLRYGIGDGYTYTLEEVGKRFKVTRERVRQIEAKATSNLQHPTRTRLLEDFLSEDPPARE